MLCSTSLRTAFVAEGDELVGLQRGLFCAGTPSALLSLWDVHDRSTSELMQKFYAEYVSNRNAAASLRTAMLAVRQEHPHPYFWAPFVLAGKVSGNTPLN